MPFAELFLPVLHPGQLCKCSCTYWSHSAQNISPHSSHLNLRLVASSLLGIFSCSMTGTLASVEFKDAVTVTLEKPRAATEEGGAAASGAGAEPKGEKQAAQDVAEG